MWFFYSNFVNLIVTDMGPRLIHVNPFKVSCVKILSKHVKFWKSYQRKLILVFFQMFTLVADIYELVQMASKMWKQQKFKNPLQTFC